MNKIEYHTRYSDTDEFDSIDNKIRQSNINDFINSIDNDLYNKIRQSNSDAECRRYLKTHLQKSIQNKIKKNR